MNEREERISLRADRAKRIFLGGANCAESIWQAFSEGLDQDEQALGNCLASGFGGGLVPETFVGPLPGASWYWDCITAGSRASHAMKC